VDREKSGVVLFVEDVIGSALRLSSGLDKKLAIVAKPLQ